VEHGKKRLGLRTKKRDCVGKGRETLEEALRENHPLVGGNEVRPTLGEKPRRTGRESMRQGGGVVRHPSFEGGG